MTEETKKNPAALSVPNLDVVHKGTEIILPIINDKPMSYDEGIKWLGRKKEEDEAKVAVYYEIECSPMDGAVAFQRSIAQIYGWAQNVPTPGFFGDRPPVMIGVATSANETMNVALGRIQIPGIDGYLNASIGDGGRPQFIISGEVRKKHSENVKKIAELTKKLVREESIYKGQAVKIGFGWLDEKGRQTREYDPTKDAPKFMELGSVKETDLIFGEAVEAALEIGLFTPIEQAEACRRYQVPLKRGILLFGPYGTGKTMTAYVSALKAVKSGWTFIYLDRVADLKRGLEFAAQYAPAVIFAEDIDRVVTGDRSVGMDDILNTLDGVDTKGAEIITVLTTNHIERINPAMLRPGRLDILVEVLPPDAKAAARLVDFYARGLLADGVDLGAVGDALDGKIPAFIREVTERAKIAAIGRTQGGQIEGEVQEIDLLRAAKAMESHAERLNVKDDSPEYREVVLRMPTNATVAPIKTKAN